MNLELNLYFNLKIQKQEVNKASTSQKASKEESTKKSIQKQVDTIKSKEELTSNVSSKTATAESVPLANTALVSKQIDNAIAKVITETNNTKTNNNAINNEEVSISLTIKQKINFFIEYFFILHIKIKQFKILFKQKKNGHMNLSPPKHLILLFLPNFILKNYNFITFK